MNDYNQSTAVLIPRGTEVELSGGSKARVYPVALRDLAAFSSAIGRATARLSSAIPEDRGDEQATLAAMVAAGTDILSEDLMELVLHCTRSDQPISIDTLELSDAAALIDGWIAENFDDPKRRAPLVKIADRILRGATSGRMSISAMLSRISAAGATASTRSSTDSSPDSPSPAGPSGS